MNFFVKQYNRKDEYSPVLFPGNWMRHAASCLLDKFGFNPWLDEVLDYYPGMSAQKFWMKYRTGLATQDNVWAARKRDHEYEIRHFYENFDYFVLRQALYRRNTTYHHAARWAKAPGARILEYGCGIAPAITWLSKRYPGAEYVGIDLDCPTRHFAWWRNRGRKNVTFKTPGFALDFNVYDGKPFNVIFCMDLFEHVPFPDHLAECLANNLAHGGVLFCDFVYNPGFANLEESAKRREATINHLNSRPDLRPVFALDTNDKSGQFGMYLKK